VSQGLSGIDYTRTVRTTWVTRGPNGPRKVTVVEEGPARPWEAPGMRRTVRVGPRETRTVWMERPAPRTTGEAVLDTVTIPVRVVRDVAVIGGRAVGTVVRTPERVAESIRGPAPEPVGERIVRVERIETTRSCACHRHPRRTTAVIHHHHRHTVLHRTGRTLERVGERTGTTIKHTAKRTGRTIHHVATRTGRTLKHTGEWIVGRRPEPVAEHYRYERVTRVGPAYPDAANDYNSNIDYNNPYR